MDRGRIKSFSIGGYRVRPESTPGPWDAIRSFDKPMGSHNAI